MEDFQIVGYDDCSLVHADQVGSFWSKLKKGVKKVGKAVGKVGKAVAKSPLVKLAATGAAFVFPPVGVPALAAVAAANGIIEATKDAKKAGKALGVIKNTRALAAKGDVGAKRAVTLLANAARASRPAARPVARPPVKAAPRPVPRPVARPPVKRPAPAPVRALPPPASSAPVVQGFLIHTAGPNRGRIDFTGGRWRRA